MALSNIDYSAGQDTMQDVFDKTNAAIDRNNTLEPVGALIPYFGTTAPNSKFLLCNGQAVSRTTYADLFALIATNYGTGDGSTTFNLPDLKGKFLVGYDPGDSDYDALTSAKSGGAKTVTLDITQIPAHTHDVFLDATNVASGSTYPNNRSTSGNSNQATSSAGGGGAHENRPPYLTINYLIRAL